MTNLKAKAACAALAVLIVALLSRSFPLLACSAVMNVSVAALLARRARRLLAGWRKRASQGTPGVWEKHRRLSRRAAARRIPGLCRAAPS